MPSINDFRAARRRAAAILALALMSAGAARLGAQESYAADMAAIDAFRVYDESGFSYDMTAVEPGGKTSVMRVSVRLKGGEAALVRYREPASERGRAVLVRGNSFWLFEPGMKNALRISPRQILTGQASAGDISRISFSLMYQVVSASGGPEGMTYSLKAKAGAGATYDLVELSTGPGHRPLRAVCRGKNGTLMKTIEYGGTQVVGGKTLIVEFAISDEVEKKTQTMRFSNFDRSIPPDAEFSVQALRFNS
jgi:outer membrane lipoprotein-sorting protein